jgi:MFS family permease
VTGRDLRTPTDAAPTRQLRHARVAVALCFFLNAVLYANLVPRLPEVKADLGLSNSSLGAALAALPLGALLAGLASAPLIRRFSSARIATSGLVLLGLAVWAVAVAPNWPALAAALLVAGALDAVVDVAQNAHGLRVQRRYGRSILNGLHGIWSIGAVSGGLLGSVAAGLAIPLVVHLGVSALVFGVCWRSVRCSPATMTPTGTPTPQPTARRPPPSSRPRADPPPSSRWRHWECSRPAAPSWRMPGPRGVRSTCAPSSPPGRRRPGWGSSRCRAP